MWLNSRRRSRIGEQMVIEVNRTSEGPNFHATMLRHVYISHLGDAHNRYFILYTPTPIQLIHHHFRRVAIDEIYVQYLFG